MITVSFLDTLRKANARLQLLFERYCSIVPFPDAEELRMLIGVQQALRDTGVQLEQPRRTSHRPEVRRELVLYCANLLRLQRELRCRDHLAPIEYPRKPLTGGEIWGDGPGLLQ
jgi:hypothetical protein